MLNSSIQPIDRTIPGAYTSELRGSVNNGNEKYSTFPRATGMEPHDQIVVSYPGHSMGQRGLALLQ